MYDTIFLMEYVLLKMMYRYPEAKRESMCLHVLERVSNVSIFLIYEYNKV